MTKTEHFAIRPGNLTLLGSIANLIVVERARQSAKISFLEYLKVGAPLTILSIGVGVWLLSYS